MRVACVVLATLALLASSSVALDDAADAAAPSPAVNPGPSADAAGGFPTTTDVNLMRWISEKGGAFAGVGVYSFVASSDDSDVADDARFGSRAMYAKEVEVPNGAEVFRLPSSAVMIAPSEAAGSVCLNRLASLDPEWALAAMILRERSARHASPHAAFIDAMYASAAERARREDAAGIRRRRGAAKNASRGRPRRVARRCARDGSRWTPCASGSDRRSSPAVLQPGAFEEALAMVHAASVRFPVDDLFRDDEGRQSQSRDGQNQGCREPRQIQIQSVALAAALVPIAHLMPHDPRGTAPCVTVHEDGATLVVKAAAGAPGTELACNQRRERRKPKPRPKVGTDGGRMTDAEALARFGTVGPGRNRGDRLALSLPTDSLLPGTHDGNGDNDSSSGAVAGPEEDDRRMETPPSTPSLATGRRANSRARSAWRPRRTPRSSSWRRDGELGPTRSADSGADTSKYGSVFARMVSEDFGEMLAALATGLYETAAAILDAYPTSDAEDEAILRRGLADEDEGTVGECRRVPRVPRVRGGSRSPRDAGSRAVPASGLVGRRRAQRVAAEVAETRLKEKVPFELRTDFGEMTGEGKRREGVGVAAGGFEARKAHYKSDEL